MGNSVSSLNQDSGVDATIPEAVGSSGASAVGSVTGGPRKTDEIRGGFVLRAKSDEAPSRRRSLVERTGMKTFVQVFLEIDTQQISKPVLFVIGLFSYFLDFSMLIKLVKLISKLLRLSWSKT